MSITRIFIDMDGVIANCSQAAARAYKVDYDPAGEYEYGWITDAYNRLHPDEPIGHGAFTRLVSAVPGFWTKIEFYPWAKDLVRWLDTAVPCEWRFLTKCIDRAECPAGKFVSLVDEFGMETARRAIMVWDRKEVCCRPGDILIDDDERNRVAWRAVGGICYNWRELGPDHPEAQQQVQQCARFCLEHTNRNVGT